MFAHDPLNELTELAPSIPGDISVLLLNLGERFAESASHGRIQLIEDLRAAFVRWWQLFFRVGPGLDAVEMIERPCEEDEREIQRRVRTDADSVAIFPILHR